MTNLKMENYRLRMLRNIPILSGKFLLWSIRQMKGKAGVVRKDDWRRDRKNARFLDIY
jgi:hypothetical protein